MIRQPCSSSPCDLLARVTQAQCRALRRREPIPRTHSWWDVIAVSPSEPWSQIELEHPAAPGTLEGSGEVELTDGVAEQVGAQRHSCAGHAVPVSAKERWVVRSAPRHACITE